MNSPLLALSRSPNKNGKDPCFGDIKLLIPTMNIIINFGVPPFSLTKFLAALLGLIVQFCLKCSSCNIRLKLFVKAIDIH